jgi:hypothetical protein
VSGREAFAAVLAGYKVRRNVWPAGYHVWVERLEDDRPAPRFAGSRQWRLRCRSASYMAHQWRSNDWEVVE